MTSDGRWLPGWGSFRCGRRCGCATKLVASPTPVEFVGKVEDTIEVFDIVFIRATHEIAVDEIEDNLAKIACLMYTPMLKDGPCHGAKTIQRILADAVNEITT